MGYDFQKEVCLLLIGLIVSTGAAADNCAHNPPKPVHHVNGVVIDSQSRPIPMVKVMLAKNGKLLQTRNTENGWFDFDDVPTGEYELRVESEKFVSATYTIIVKRGRSTGGREWLQVRMALSGECGGIGVMKWRYV